MTILEGIKKRRSIRKFREEAISEDIIRELLEAATYAPSGMNAQPWAFAVVEDPAFLKSWSDKSKSFFLSAMEQLPHLNRYRNTFENPDYNIFYNAPVVVLIYGDTGSATYINDCSMAAQNLMLAAYEKGIGSCWIGFAVYLGNEQDIKSQLGVPDNYQLVAPIVLGYPVQERLVIPQRKAADILTWKR